MSLDEVGTSEGKIMWGNWRVYRIGLWLVIPIAVPTKLAAKLVKMGYAWCPKYSWWYKAVPSVDESTIAPDGEGLRAGEPFAEGA